MLKTQEGPQIPDHVLERIPVHPFGAELDEILYVSEGEHCQCLMILMVANTHQELVQILLVRPYGRGLQAAHSVQMIQEKIEFRIYRCLRLSWGRSKTTIFSEKILHLANCAGSFRPKVTIVLPGCLCRNSK